MKQYTMKAANKSGILFENQEETLFIDFILNSLRLTHPKANKDDKQKKITVGGIGKIV